MVRFLSSVRDIIGAGSDVLFDAVHCISELSQREWLGEIIDCECRRGGCRVLRGVVGIEGRF